MKGMLVAFQELRNIQVAIDQCRDTTSGCSTNRVEDCVAWLLSGMPLGRRASVGKPCVTHVVEGSRGWL